MNVGFTERRSHGAVKIIETEQSDRLVCTFSNIYAIVILPHVKRELVVNQANLIIPFGTSLQGQSELHL